MKDPMSAVGGLDLRTGGTRGELTNGELTNSELTGVLLKTKGGKSSSSCS